MESREHLEEHLYLQQDLVVAFPLELPNAHCQVPRLRQCRRNHKAEQHSSWLIRNRRIPVGQEEAHTKEQGVLERDEHSSEHAPLSPVDHVFKQKQPHEEEHAQNGHGGVVHMVEDQVPVSLLFQEEHLQDQKVRVVFYVLVSNMVALLAFLELELGRVHQHLKRLPAVHAVLPHYNK